MRPLRARAFLKRNVPALDRIQFLPEMIKLADHPVIADFVGPAILRLSNALADYWDALPRERCVFHATPGTDRAA